MRKWKSAFALSLAALAGGAAALLYWRRKPSACPYEGRFFVEMPRPFLTRPEMREILAPRPGERMLEVGPGTGYYSLAAAGWVAPEGSLDVFDIQREMLDHTMRKAREYGVVNIKPTQGDAADLPYDDDSFDAAFLVATLGEVPDQDGALRELRRVIRPGGRLVVGEALFDPHRVSQKTLRSRAGKAGLTFERATGGTLGYFARFGG